MDCRPPGSSVHGVSQARIPEQVVIFFSRGSSWPRDWTHVSCTAGRFFTTRFLGSPVTPIRTTDNTQKDCIKFPLTEASLRYSSPIIKENVKKQKKRWEFWLHAQNPLYRCCLCMGRVHFSSVQSVMSNSLWPHGLQHTRPPCPSPTPRAYSNSCPSSWWCHPTISSSVVLFFSCLQFFPSWESFLMSQFCTLGGQSIGASPSALVSPMNIQDWFPLGWTGLISLQSKGLSRVFSKTTVQKHQFFSAQFSLWSNSYISTWLLEKP